MNSGRIQSSNNTVTYCMLIGPPDVTIELSIIMLEENISAQLAHNVAILVGMVNYVYSIYVF